MFKQTIMLFIFLYTMEVLFSHFFLALSMTLSLLTLNTGGRSTSLRNVSVRTYVDEIAPKSDIIFLQETNNLSEHSFTGMKNIKVIKSGKMLRTMMFLRLKLKFFQTF